MRRFPVAPAIVLLTVVIGIIGWRFSIPSEYRRLQEVAATRKARSEIYTRMLVRYDKPPIYEEEYRMADVEGVSTYDYRIRAYNGKEITITQPPRRMYDVSYFYGSLDQDGVWQLTNRPLRGNATVHYTVYVKQLVDFKQGERTITFTDPHYWATTAGRQYQIDLSKQKPSDLLTMQSTQLADPHYADVVRDFREFGPPTFRSKIAAAQARIRSGK